MSVTETGVGPFTNAFTTTTADTINFTTPFPRIRISNLDAVNPIYFRMDGVVPIAEADGCRMVPASGQREFASELSWRAGSAQVQVGLVGSAGKYVIEGLQTTH